MKKRRYSFSVVDFLVALAVLMILAALFVPHFIEPGSKASAATPAPRAATAQPRR